MTELAKVDHENAQPAMAADPMVSMIERVALSPDLPIERLERMMDLKDRHDENQRRDRAEEAERAFNAAMAKAQAAMPTVVKTKRNDHTRSTYADLSDIEEQAMPIAYNHGFSVSFVPAGKDENDNLLIDWCLMHEAGHTRKGQAGFPLDGAGAQGKTNKTGIQAMGSTMTYGRRYLICNLFNIATDDDNDGQSATCATITEEQFVELSDLLESANIDPAVVCQAERINQLAELPASKFAHVKSQIATTIRKREAAQ